MTIETHEVDRNLDLARTLGISPQSTKMKISVSESDRTKAANVIVSHRFDPERLICLQTGSSELQSWKRWPAPKWAELSRKLSEQGYNLAFIGSKEETSIAEVIIAESSLRSDGINLNVCGALSLNATAALIEKSLGLVCNDSGLMHVAAAVGVPIVGIFGPTEFERTRPFVDNCVLLRGQCSCNGGTLFDKSTLKQILDCDRPCLNDTSPEEVLTAIYHLMPIDPIKVKSASVQDGS